MHGYVSKHVKMHKKPMGGTNKHGKYIIARSGKGERCAQRNRHHGDALHPNKASWASDVTTQGQARRGGQTWRSLELERVTQA